jgi:outer membrane protein OmpA-like peptidoglycan-associated protein
MKARGITILAASALLLLAAVPLVQAQEQETDAENCRDHPLLSRMKGFYISECEKLDFDEVEFELEDGSTKTVEGKKTVIQYYLREGQQRPSYLQIRRNYGNALKAIGGKALLDADWRGAFQLVREGKEIWVKLEIYNEGAQYTLTILEIAGMVQEISADAMFEALSKDGFIALYINFDTGKSDIKTEMQGTINQIAALLNGHPELKVGIEGHTDNVGTPAANKALSEARAKSVMAAVVKGGVAASRLSAVGWGQEKPLADNRSEEGRAKNRRVEIVKK